MSDSNTCPSENDPTGFNWWCGCDSTDPTLGPCITCFQNTKPTQSNSTAFSICLQSIVTGSKQEQQGGVMSKTRTFDLQSPFAC
jgi:hypothetical protein